MSKVLGILLLILGLSPAQARVLTGRFPKNFAHLLDSISKEELARSKAGLSLFAKPWVQAPSSTLLRNGLGPYFNAVSCMSCHPGFGRGAPVGVIHPMDPALLFKIRGPVGPYGPQLQNQAISGLAPEANIGVNWSDYNVQNGEEVVTLQSPTYYLKDALFGELTKEQYLSPRIAPHVAGLGKIDQITDADIIANENRGKNGIAHRLNGGIGKMGWKAEQVDSHHQTAAAFSGDLGITNPLFQEQPCTSEQKECQSFPDGAEIEEGHHFEISEKHMAYVSEMIWNIAPPARIMKPELTESISRGEKLFEKTNCTSCHRPSYTLPSGEEIKPYSDFLLHDMGDKLADNLETTDMIARRFKTPPLWGLGSQSIVNGHENLLHDGRARNIKEAILWHGGDAAAEQQNFTKLSPADQQDLINFLRSL